MNSRKASFSALAVVVCLATAAHADVCVWRDPDRAMARIFPAAADYTTVDVKIAPETLARIEKRLGKPLDPGERDNWIYYAISGRKGEVLGHVLTDAESGEYGAIEIVLGIGADDRISSIYIQRARERDKVFKSKDFLDQFIGKTLKDPLKIGDDISAKNTAATERVAFGVRKMMVMYDELKSKPREGGKEQDKP